MSDLNILVDEISTVSAKWEKLGQGLGLSMKSLQDIRTLCRTSHDCLTETLRRRLQEYTDWTHIFDSLRGIGECQLAGQLKEKYIPGMLTATARNIDLCESLYSVHNGVS